MVFNSFAPLEKHVLTQIVIEKYHRHVVLANNIYFSQFWRLEVQCEGARMIG